MWIVRFHLLQPKDYNRLSRICKKYGFVTKKHSPVIYCKASLKHATQKTSWRALGREFGVDHISLYKFWQHSKQSEMLEEIFHVFVDTRIALYIGNTKSVHVENLDNSADIILLTKKELESMLSKLKN